MKIHFNSLLIAGICLLTACSTGAPDWMAEAEKIVSEIQLPVFPNAEFVVDAPSDGVQDALPAITKAINLCSKSGGGKVILPRGRYFCKGSVVLKSDVNFHFEDGAELLFSPDPEDYLPGMLTMWEGTELINYKPLIYAYMCDNIAITGKGVINGQASKGRFSEMRRPFFEAQQLQIRTWGFNCTPVQDRNFGAESLLPTALLQLWGCSRILLEDYKLIDSPFWCQHIVYCDNLTVRGLTVDSHDRNSDGIDPDYTRDVLIENCRFDTGDDCIAIKAGRDKDGWRSGKKSRNIVIRNNEFESGSGGVILGSEMAAGVENVFIFDNHIHNCKVGIGLRGCKDRGGFIRHIRVDNIQCDSAWHCFVKLDNRYSSPMNGNVTPAYSDIVITNSYCHYSDDGGIGFIGVEDCPISDIHFSNVTIDRCETPLILENFTDATFDAVSINGNVIDRIQQPTQGVKFHKVRKTKKMPE